MLFQQNGSFLLSHLTLDCCPLTLLITQLCKGASLTFSFVSRGHECFFLRKHLCQDGGETFCKVRLDGIEIAQYLFVVFDDDLIFLVAIDIMNEDKTWCHGSIRVIVCVAITIYQRL